MIDLSSPQRQSPLAVAFLAIRLIRNLGFAQLAVIALFLFQAPLDGPLIFLPFALALVLGAIASLSWWRYTFQLIDGELVVVKGVLSVDRLTVPIDRIQSISIDQELLHRLTGLVKVSVDTAGSAEAEFAIDAVSRSVAEQLQREAVTAASARIDLTSGAGSIGAAEPVEPDRVVFTHDAGRLVRTALTMWPLSGLIVLAPLFALGDQFARQAEARLGDIDLDASQLAWTWAPAFIVGFLAVSVLLNIARVILADWELTLRTSDTSLRRTSGLLSRTSKASSVARVQVVSTSQNILQQRAALSTVEMSTIGERDLGLIGWDASQVEVVRALAGSAAPAFDRRVHPAEVFLAVRNTTVGMAVAAFAGWFIVSWWSLLVFLAVPLVWWSTRRHVRNFRWSLDTELATFTHVIDRSTRQALLRKTNAVQVTQSVFQRRRGLGYVHVVTAAGTISVGMLPSEEPHAARDRILAAAETDPRPWM